MAPEGGYSIDERRAMLSRYNRVVKTILTMEKPVLSVVRGYAVGGGMSLALCCDIIFAAEDAKFYGNFVKAGIVPEMGAMMILPQLIGLNRAKELWFTGETVDGKRACELGFVNHAYPSESLDEEVYAFARTLARHAEDSHGHNQARDEFHGACRPRRPPGVRAAGVSVLREHRGVQKAA